MDTNSVNCGWLLKSPPDKILSWKTWTRRWFVLKQSGQIPGQYLLEYYTDQNCKKLKGRIDLDQCERVDAGLTGTNYNGRQFMFDVRTAKRVYYLAADTESEMQKWIQCICSVCGLKVHYDDYRYSPQPSQEYSDNATTSNNSTSNRSNSMNIRNSKQRSGQTNSSSTNVIRTEPLSRSHSDRLSSSSTNNLSSTATTTKKKYEPSGPYVPIWETNTGKPIIDRAPLKENSRDNISSIPLQSFHSSLHRHQNRSTQQSPENDAYDIPRPLNLPSTVNNNSTEDILNKVIPTKNKNLSKDNCPKINWKTHPSVDTLDNLSNNNNRTLKKSLSQTSKDINLETRRASTPNANYYNSETIVLNELNQPPPRPPKPENLRKSRNNSETFVFSNMPETPSPSYDILNKIIDNVDKRDIDLIQSNKNQLNNIIKPPSLSLASPVVSQNTLMNTPVNADDMYDIPKPCEQQIAVGDILNTVIPVNTLSKKQGLHSYTNAPVGHVSTKESIFIYDSKPCLPTTSDDQVTPRFDSESLDRSPISPTSPFYTNFANSVLKANTPPAVNRDLKPRRKGSDSDATASPTTPGPVFNLSLPPGPDVYHSNNKAFRKPSPNRLPNGTAPRIPSRGRTVVHSREASASEDEFCNRSRRNSNDDQMRKTITAPPRKHYTECSQIQYLDLSLGDNKSSSSKSKNNKLGKKGSDNHKSLSSLTKETENNNNTNRNTYSNTNTSPSTVYKTVDFLKTEALHKLRLNLKGSLRNSQ